jgi:thiosulfate reductase cytochrome b subunit
MAVERHTSARPAVRVQPGRLLGGGTAGNERLTAAAGALLIVLLAVIGVTIIQLGGLLSVHLFVGMMLLGPLVLKLASTGYRFARYYMANPRYRRKGPPPLPLRLLAPIVVLSTLVVFASGVALLFAGPSSRDTLLPIHKISFIVSGVFMAPHVLAHLPSLYRSLRADYGRSASRGGPAGLRADVNGRSGRTLSLASALVLGVVLAILVIPQFGPWLSAHH